MYIKYDKFWLSYKNLYLAKYMFIVVDDNTSKGAVGLTICISQFHELYYFFIHIFFIIHAKMMVKLLLPAPVLSFENINYQGMAF